MAQPLQIEQTCLHLQTSQRQVVSVLHFVAHSGWYLDRASVVVADQVEHMHRSGKPIQFFLVVAVF